MTAAGVVGGSLIDPEQIANDHIRINAREGQLFREVVREAAVEGGLRCSVWRERDLVEIATEALGKSERRLRAAAAAFGRAIDGPWRAEQKAAAVAAWLALARRGRASRSDR
jgi:hypothetical protein